MARSSEYLLSTYETSCEIWEEFIKLLKPEERKNKTKDYNEKM